MRLTNGGKLLVVFVLSFAIIGMALSDVATAYHKFVVLPARVIK